MVDGGRLINSAFRKVGVLGLQLLAQSAHDRRRLAVTVSVVTKFLKFGMSCCSFKFIVCLFYFMEPQVPSVKA